MKLTPFETNAESAAILAFSNGLETLLRRWQTDNHSGFNREMKQLIGNMNRAAQSFKFYVGCSNDCDYCYCKRGVLGHAMGAPVATLKKCFKDEAHAFEVFHNEVKANLEVLRKHGLFFTFTSDPMLDNTRQLTINAVGHAVSFGIPCKILTKRADFIDYLPGEWFVNEWYKSRWSAVQVPMQSV